MVIKFFALILLIISIVFIALRRSSSKFNKKDVKVTNAEEYAFNVKFHDFIYELSKKTHSSSVGGMNCSNLDFQYIF